MAIRKHNFIFILFLLQLLCTNIRAQIVSQYNLNTLTGLPSNHVYCTLIDKQGYLWMGTDKGAVRYNGYTIKLFNHTNGIAKDDIWRIYQDKKGRVWLFSISDEIGYVYNDQYHKTYNSTHVSLYVGNIYETSTGIAFSSPFVNGKALSLCIEKNDTIINYESYPAFYTLLINKQTNRMLQVAENSIFKVKISPDKHNIQLEKICESNNIKDAFSHFKYNTMYAYSHYVIAFAHSGTFINVIDLNNCTYRKIVLDTLFKKDKTIFQLCDANNEVSTARKCLFISSNKNIYFLDSNLHVFHRYAADSISTKGLKGDDINYITESTFWHQCVSTTSHGIFINYHTPLQFYHDSSINLSGYIVIAAFDTITYWWNEEKSTIAVLHNNNAITYKKYGSYFVANKVVPYNKDSAMILGVSDVFWMNTHTLAIKNIFTSFMREKKTNLLWNGMDAIIMKDRHDIYSLSQGDGLVHCELQPDGTYYPHIITRDRYTGMMYDTNRHLFCLYTSNKLFFYYENGTQWSVNADELKTLGITNIEKMLIDNKYSNIYIKDAAGLFVYDLYTHIFRKVLNNLTLEDASIHLYKNKLIVVGNFGIAFCNINGPLQLSTPIVYNNIKSVFYRTIKEVSMLGNTVLLNTDNGIYRVNIPSIFNNIVETTEPYKFLLSYNDRVLDINHIDTLRIYQDQPILQFDVINPTGIGTIKYKYSLANTGINWHELNSNELNLPRLDAGYTYTLSLVAYDKFWKSDKKIIHLYITPKWWQTTTWKIIFFISSLIILAFIITIAAIITKGVVIKNAVRKNKQLELELRSIYSQINPHFIFNSLNSGLSLIKMKELDNAYTHISRFSSLLRSYIKSSRNRFISLAEEITNLKNYIELQQTRYKERFDYEITIDTRINSEELKIPTLLLQPIVENAIIHGLLNKKEKGLLTIRFNLSESEKEIICVIDDDGIGREKSKLLNSESSVKKESFGSDLIADLIKILNTYENMNISIRYVDKHPPYTGTTVEIQMNLLYA